MAKTVSKQEERPVVCLFKCCMVDGVYYGDTVHDPQEPSDGPWYLSISRGDVRIELGFGEKEKALEALYALASPSEYEFDIDPWD